MSIEKNERPVLLPSIADMLFITVLLFLGLMAGDSLLADADTGYHIRAGEYILDNLTVPMHDIFSLWNPPIPWTAHEWLSEVVMAMIHRVFGLTGVVLFFGLLIASVYALLFRFVRAGSENIVSAVVVVLLAIGASQIHWLARPHIFSLMLLVLWYHLLDDYQYRDKNRLFLLPPLMVLWVNLHGGYIIGIALVCLYVLCNLVLSFPASEDVRSVYLRKVRVFAIAGAASVMAALVNPRGLHILLFPFRLTSNKSIVDNVSEFLSPNFHEPMVFTLMVLFMIVLLSFARRRMNLIETGLLLLFFYMALFSARYIPLFAIIASPILARRLDAVLADGDSSFSRFMKARAERLTSADRSARPYLWSLGAVLLISALAWTGVIRYVFDPKLKPVAAVDFMLREKIGGNMFDNDEFGDYIIYAAWPRYRVFFDGRSDMYGTERIKDYFTVVKLEPDWEKVVEKHRINWFIFDSKSPLCQYLLVRPDWRLIYADEVAFIFVKNTPENARLIAKYGNTKPVYPKKDISSAPCGT